MYQEKTFEIKDLIGISAKSIEEHYKLYLGYVKNANGILSTIKELSNDLEKNTYTISELRRRFSFEFDGMRNHEYYFSALVGGHVPLSDGPLKEIILSQWGSFEVFMNEYISLALTRGIGWAILSYDKKQEKLVLSWADEQHLGMLTGLSPIVMLDMWEHSFVFDYQPSGKKQYVLDYFANLNWSVIEKNFIEVQ
jgi:Fe-Mn family superoxide dismutase